METKQIAVEWLEEKLKEYKYLNKNADHYFEQAKEMEKQQIMDAYNNGENRSAELYYNETYGK